jgi:hypothetical protein
VQIAGACLLTALFGTTDSVSRAMRSYWFLLTYSFLFLCVVVTLGVGPAIQISFLASLVMIPSSYLEHRYPAGDQEPPLTPKDLADALARQLLRGRIPYH